MAIGTLYLSTQTYDWPATEDRKFLTHKNYLKILNDPEVHDCYTSLEDITVMNASEVIKGANDIVLVGLDESSIIEMDESSMYGYFHFIRLARHKIRNDLNFLDNIFSAIDRRHDQRSSDGPLLWNVGGSFTSGVGVDPTQRYSQLLSESLDMDEIMLASTGSSISWSADQVLRSDIRRGDIVVWGLTNSCRADYNDGFDLTSISVTDYPKLEMEKQFWRLDYFDSLTINIKCLRRILQVVNFCDKIGARLYLVNLLDYGFVSLLLGRLDNFIDLSRTDQFDTKSGPMYLDYGTDGQHPGPKQHELYAREIYKFIEDRRG